MKTKQRLTKAAVLEQVQILRKQLVRYTSMTHDQLVEEHRLVRPEEDCGRYSREVLIRNLLMSATYYTTMVLDLE